MGNHFKCFKLGLGVEGSWKVRKSDDGLKKEVELCSWNYSIDRKVLYKYEATICSNWSKGNIFIFLPDTAICKNGQWLFSRCGEHVWNALNSELKCEPCGIYKIHFESIWHGMASLCRSCKGGLSRCLSNCSIAFCFIHWNSFHFYRKGHLKGPFKGTF